jgi:nicotinate-nucleotide adenylyltransferase
MKTVALYGGSFDPPHIGHEAIINELKKLDFIDKIMLMPTYLNPFKDSFVAPATLRLHWLHKLFSDDEKVIVSDYEVKQKRKVTTIESVLNLKKEFEKIYVVIGADNLASLHKWHRYDELKELVTFIVVTRNGIKIPKEFIKITLDKPISSSQLRTAIKKEYLPKKCACEIAQYYKENNATKN